MKKIKWEYQQFEQGSKEERYLEIKKLMKNMKLTSMGLKEYDPADLVNLEFHIDKYLESWVTQ